LRAPDQTAFLWLENGERETATITFGGLDRRARAICRMLADRRLDGKPVLLAYHSGLDLVAAAFGCFYAGAIAVVVPLPTSQSLNRLRSLALDAGAPVVLCPASLAEKVGREAPASVEVITTDGPDATGDDSPPPSPDPQSLAMLQYTSGSTTSPRGVMLTHTNLMNNLHAMALGAEMVEGETAVSWLPFHHDMGLLGFGFFPIYAGLRCVLMPAVAFLKRPARWLEAIDRYGAALSAGPCFAFDLCERRTTADQRGVLDLARWRRAVCGGEVIRPEVLERFAETFAEVGFRRAAFAPAYGLAEATVLAASVRADESLSILSVDGPMLAEGRGAPPANAARARRLVSCGQPWPGHELMVVDPIKRTALDADKIGEIWLRGASVCRGYWGRPAETAATFDAALDDVHDVGGWLRTGDLGFMSAEGLVVTGRRKDMIIVRGTNFDPLDLEVAAQGSHLALTPGGGGAFSFDDGTGERVVLAHEVERSSMKGLDTDAIVERVAEAVSQKFGLALHDLVLLPPGALPRTTSGKVQRHLCREQYLDGRLGNPAELRNPALGRWRSSRPL
jgi:acyl-CoA synthetase (AMP-forming)/AMP-acid ligase II